jgi:2-dehydro-3-deoxyphosphogluconate aldolase/(4S)-4-hydroxy-2-oxoglutarate aldolase
MSNNPSQDPIIETYMKVSPIMPVMVIDDLAKALPLADALMNGGINVLEVTLRTECALEAIALIRRERPRAVVAAGTVLNPEHAEQAVSAGAHFSVSPGLTLELARQTSLPLLPGVATASEVMQAMEWGFTFLKFFPAVPAGGVSALKGIGGPLPQARFCPTGGIDAKNAADFLRLSNVLCVGGSWVAPSDLMAKGQWDDITALCQSSLNALKEALQ